MEHLTGENNLCILVGFSKGWFVVPSSERGGGARHREGKLVRGADPAPTSWDVPAASVAAASLLS